MQNWNNILHTIPIRWHTYGWHDALHNVHCFLNMVYRRLWHVAHQKVHTNTLKKICMYIWMFIWINTLLLNETLILFSTPTYWTYALLNLNYPYTLPSFIYSRRTICSCEFTTHLFNMWNKNKIHCTSRLQLWFKKKKRRGML